MKLPATIETTDQIASFIRYLLCQENLNLTRIRLSAIMPMMREIQPTPPNNAPNENACLTSALRWPTNESTKSACP